MQEESEMVNIPNQIFHVQKLVQEYTESIQSLLNKLIEKINRLESEDISFECKRLNSDAFLPERATSGSACWDLKTPIKVIVPARGNVLVKTGLAFSWDTTKYYMKIETRSSTSYKNNIVTQAGVIDADYLREVGVLLQNNTDQDQEYEKGHSIAQFCLVRINIQDYKVVDELTVHNFGDKERVGGFGSTDRK